MRDQTLKRRDLNVSDTLGCTGKQIVILILVVTTQKEALGLVRHAKWGGLGCVSCVYVIVRSVSMEWVPV